ncbi:hypothetical protein B1C78_03120 [Thioalkalivibrio denitrificans]|uniref:Uncharacterized protein n=1 Tax=Thioalkalivibrio denitrificans TaxID=108003 RepID=A0A1V3NRD1_9GAMM|nr:hypothetical protein B1C78_03120 [Thioalkalivibrio denitrificans]
MTKRVIKGDAPLDDRLPALSWQTVSDANIVSCRAAGDTGVIGQGMHVERGSDLARISHHPSTAAADLLAVTGRLLRCAVPAPLAVQGVRPARPLGGLRRSTGPSVPPRPSSRLDVVSATPAPSSGPRAPSQRHLDALATNGGEICGLVVISQYVVHPG